MFCILLLKTGLFNGERANIGNLLYYFYKVQLLVYNIYTLFIIYKYRYNIKFQTSASEESKT